MSSKIISIFNNKGGVGKTTLTFHFAHALAAMGKRVLIVDLDPQCNLTIYCMEINKIQEIWDAENAYIDEPGFGETKKSVPPKSFTTLCSTPRTIHFLLKPAEEGTGEIDQLPPPVNLAAGLDLIPGRLTLHMFEEMVARRWSDAFVGQPLAIRTLSEIRRLIQDYSDRHGYDYAIVDTSPSLGPLNKLVLSTVDAFLIPCAPDLFSLYGIRNIGNSISRWRQEWRTLYGLIGEARRPHLPKEAVRFLGYTIYNAKLRSGSSKWNMAIAHYDYAKQIPSVIGQHMPPDLSAGIPQRSLKEPIGNQAVMHTHNTFPSSAQKYHCPMWELPGNAALEPEDDTTIRPNAARYRATKDSYTEFAAAVLERLHAVESK